jgi:hypothetical protein
MKIGVVETEQATCRYFSIDGIAPVSSFKKQ